MARGVHACAVLICRDPSTSTCPPSSTPKGGVEVTQLRRSYCCRHGLALKMDFLGLRTLTVISKAKPTSKNFGIDIKEEEIPFDDPEIFKLMGSGHHRRRLSGRVRRHDGHDPRT